jgi:hypothetical protein
LPRGEVDGGEGEAEECGLEPAAWVKGAEARQPAAAASVREASALRREQVRSAARFVATFMASFMAISSFFTDTSIKRCAQGMKAGAENT